MNTKNTIVSCVRNPSNRKISGFTLVELIVVITILAILGTIAFLSLQQYTGSARDSSRISDISNISRSIELANINLGNYPLPDNSITITYSGGTVWTQGTIGDSVIRKIGKLSKKPVDPLDGTEYTYSVTASQGEYSIKGNYEGDSLSFRIPDSIGVETTYASSMKPTLTYIKGNYNGVVAKTQTGNIIYLLALPSIISGTGGIGSILKIEMNDLSGMLLIHGKSSSGGITFNPSIVYSSGSLPATSTDYQSFATALANVYSGTALASVPNIQPFVSALTDSNSGTLLTSLGRRVVSISLGGAGTSSSSSSGGSPTIVNATCGQDATTYASGSGTFLGSTAGDFCTTANSTLSGGINPTFPNAGSSVNWTCNSTSGGSTASCTATRSAPSDPNWSNVVLAMHMDGTNGGTSFVDEKGHIITANGTISTDTTATNYKFGASGNFGGGYLSLPVSANYILGTGDFTVEFWMKGASVSGGYARRFIVLGSNGSAGTFQINLNQTMPNTIRVDIGSATSITGTIPVTDNSWHYVAVVRNSGVISIYVDGVLDKSQTDTTNFTFSGNGSIGQDVSLGASSAFNGYIDDVRITQGISRYNMGFTPPTIAFPNQ